MSPPSPSSTAISASSASICGWYSSLIRSRAAWNSSLSACETSLFSCFIVLILAISSTGVIATASSIASVVVEFAGALRQLVLLPAIRRGAPAWAAVDPSNALSTGLAHHPAVHEGLVDVFLDAGPDRFAEFRVHGDRGDGDQGVSAASMSMKPRSIALSMIISTASVGGFADEIEVEEEQFAVLVERVCIEDLVVSD
ncbi:MAG: hypothetical protein MZU97_11895 [Bacillus subtilis]|nr:hypothetical protein [Bacillus subtilis]